MDCFFSYIYRNLLNLLNTWLALTYVRYISDIQFNYLKIFFCLKVCFYIVLFSYVFLLVTYSFPLKLIWCDTSKLNKKIFSIIFDLDIYNFKNTFLYRIYYLVYVKSYFMYLIHCVFYHKHPLLQGYIHDIKCSYYSMIYL